jgi:hypothetical protein
VASRYAKRLLSVLGDKLSSYSIQLALDDDGFLRRECPHCSQQFKWHHGPTGERPPGEVDPAVYCCPRCGASAAPDQWFTQAQIAYIEDAMAGPVSREASEAIEKAFRDVRGIAFKRNSLDEPEPPHALQEPNDMIITAPPCHPWEPVKVPEGVASQVHCLICGAPFAV